MQDRNKALGIERLKVWQAKDFCDLERWQDRNSGGAYKKLSQNQKATAALLVRQEIAPQKPIPLSPLLCVLPDDFTKEDFLETEKFEVFSITAEKDAPLCFCARIQTKKLELKCPIPAAIDFSQAKNVSLEKTFSLAKELSLKSQGKDLVLAPTSFYFARAQIGKNTWSLYDAVWLKITSKPCRL